MRGRRAKEDSPGALCEGSPLAERHEMQKDIPLEDWPNSSFVTLRGGRAPLPERGGSWVRRCAPRKGLRLEAD